MKTRHKKIAALASVAVVVLLVLCVCAWKGGWFHQPAQQPQPSSSQSTLLVQDNILMNAPFETEKFLTNDGENTIYRGYIQITKAALNAVTQAQFVEFVLSRVENSGFDWITIFCDDGTGIVFQNSDIQHPQYGQVDDIGRITQPIAQIYTVGADYSAYHDTATTGAAVPVSQEAASAS